MLTPTLVLGGLTLGAALLVFAISKSFEESAPKAKSKVKVKVKVKTKAKGKGKK